jgi:hypothetical protein
MNKSSRQDHARDDAGDVREGELTAGGHDKDKGDADVFNDKGWRSSSLTRPERSTITGSFKFAVCDGGHQCLPKEPFAIQVAAK